MAYNNNGGAYRQGGYNNNRSYNSNGYNNQNQGYNRNNGGSGKKHSGATTKRYVPQSGANKGHEMHITNGWMFRKRTGLITFKCNTTSKSVLQESGWMGSIACEVINKGTGQKSFYWGTMEAKTGKVVIGDLGIVVSPKGGKGGYTGSFTK